MGNKQLTILAVDDEAHGLSALTDIIQQTNKITHCEKATSVKSAIQTANEKCPSILVVDYHLGDGTALDIISALNMKHKSIIVSADAKVQQISEENGIPFLMKPLQTKELEPIIQSLSNN